MISRRSVLSALSALGGLLLVAFLALCVYAFAAVSDYYLLLPDKPHELAPLVEVQGGRESGPGEVYFVDVVTRRASLAERHLPFLRRDAELVSKDLLVPDDIDEREQARLDAAAMTRSKEIAGAVALKSLGYEVDVQPRGAVVEQTAKDSPARARLLPGDVIVAVDGEPVRLISRLRALVGRHRVGQKLTLTIRRDRKQRRVALRTYAPPDNPGVPALGVLVSQEAKIELPLEVEIDTGNVVGPSAGLAFALQIANELGDNVDRGYRIAATGELALDGSVFSIGGVRQKVTGARRAGIEIMLVPAGDNATEARLYAGEMKIIAVNSFQQALRALATLPAKK